MWHIVAEEQQKQMRESQEKEFLRHAEEAKRKQDARAAFIKSGTCPHCGQCPPLPPWLL